MREQAKVYATLALLIMGILIFNILSPNGAANAGHHAEAILKLNGFVLCMQIQVIKAHHFILLQIEKIAAKIGMYIIAAP